MGCGGRGRKKVSAREHPGLAIYTKILKPRLMQPQQEGHLQGTAEAFK